MKFYYKVNSVLSIILVLQEVSKTQPIIQYTGMIFLSRDRMKFNELNNVLKYCNFNPLLLAAPLENMSSC